MGEIVVFPEQVSFDVRQQRTAKRVRLSIKNLGNIACKVQVHPPETDSFVLTNAKGHIITSVTKFTLTSESSECLFIAKGSNVGIVPDDKIVIEGGKKPLKVVLKPAVSLVSVDELEAAVKAEQHSKTPKSARSASKQSSKVLLSDDDGVREIPSRSSFKRPQQTDKNNEQDLTFEEADFALNMRPKSDRTSQCSVRSGKSSARSIREKQEIQVPEIETEPPQPVQEREQETPRKRSKLPVPAVLKEDPTPKRSGIPKRHHHNDLPYTPEMDILEQSIHLKIKNDDNNESENQSTIVNWYEPDAFAELEEPNYTFELMMTGEGEDPIFCIDGDYYDSSGCLLTVQQGKPGVIFVTEQGNKNI